MSTFETNPKELKALLSLIESGDLALPDFQRDFVWDPGAVEELIESIMRQYPVGSLLFLKDSGSKFQVREFETAPKLSSQNSPSQLVLDGQQRLTSLYQAFTGKGEHLFFISLKHLRDEIDIEGAVFNLSRKKATKFGYTEIQGQAKYLVVPLSIVFQEAFEEWIDQILELRKDESSEKELLKKDLRNIRKEFLSPMLSYKLPVITLQKETTMDAVCKMFETLNRRGVKLTVFELLMARAFASNVSLRQLWEKALNDYPIIKEFDIDPYYVLQVATLINQNSIKRRDVLELEPEIVSSQWDLLTGSIAEALRILQSEEGVLSPRFMPYYTMLVPLAALIAKLGKQNEIERGKRNQKIRKWFWASVFGSTYEVGPTARSVSDYKELLRWIKDGEDVELYALKKIYVTEDMLKEVGPKQRAHYNGVMALILDQGAKDFHNGSKINKDYIDNKSLDDHHIFPKNYLKKKKIREEVINCVLNRTMIDGSTNRTISDHAPSKYIGKIEKELGQGTLNSILESHQINRKHLESDDFEEFLNQRAKNVINLLSKKLGQAVPDRPQIDDVSDVDEIEDEGSRKDLVDPKLVNQIPELALNEYPQIVGELFRELNKRLFEINPEIWSRLNKQDNISYWTPDKSFVRITFQKSGLKLLVFTDADLLPGVQNINQKDGGGKLYGRAKIKSLDEIQKILPSLKKSFDLMNKATASGRNTSWWRGVKKN